MLKKVIAYQNEQNKHWVGNGFHVYGLLRPNEKINPIISPFILMDYASPKEFQSSIVPKGVGEHPHRGFETVTFAYQGEIQHRDSAGGGGIIRAGDVQWMTAGRGVVHDEFHSEYFSKIGGVFEMVQLWINLPKEFKMTSPKYQSIKKKEIPCIKLNNDINIRLIAGDYKNKLGPAKTFTKIKIMELYSKSKSNITLDLDENTNTVLFIRNGSIDLQGVSYKDKSVIIFDQKGTKINFKTTNNLKALLLNGEPIEEPLVSYGPFVMNTKKEIEDAINDYKNGKMGNLL